MDVRNIPGERETEAVMRGIWNDRGRENKVQCSIQRAKDRGCSFILLPGWGLVANSLPPWLMASSKDITIVIECLHVNPQYDPEFRAKGGLLPEGTDIWNWLTGKTYVVYDGKEILGPVTQRIAADRDLSRGGDLSAGARDLVRDLVERRRSWMVPGIGAAVLYICGEVNIVKGGQNIPGECRIYPLAERGGLKEAHLLAPLIVNPSHTRSNPNAMRSKRAWLASTGLLIHTGNIHFGGWVRDGTSERASHKAAKIWVRGEPRDQDLATSLPRGKKGMC